MTAAGRFAIGLIFGLVAAFGLVRLTADDSAVTTTSTTSPPTTTTEGPADPWFEPTEVLIGETALLPRTLEVEDGMVFFDYDLAGLAPVAAEAEDQDGGSSLTWPEEWELTTVGGQVVPGTTGPFDTSVRFDLPDPEDEVASIRLVQWRVAVPFGERFEIAVESGATATTRRGTATVATVLEQSISTIVQVDFADNGGSWDNVVLRPVDGTWRFSFRQGGGLQVTWDGSDAPDTLLLEDFGFELRPVSGDVLVVDETL